MLKYLLDTNTISEPARPSPNRCLLERLERNAEALAIAAPVWHELLFGLQRLPPSAKRTRIEGYIFSSVIDLPILPYDAVAAEWHAAQRARQEAKGRVIPFVDELYFREKSDTAYCNDCLVCNVLFGDELLAAKPLQSP